LIIELISKYFLRILITIMIFCSAHEKDGHDNPRPMRSRAARGRAVGAAARARASDFIVEGGGGVLEEQTKERGRRSGGGISNSGSGGGGNAATNSQVPPC
jgi:hypothetical protein